MGRRGRKPPVRVTLDSGDVKSLSDDEVRMILRGADELIAAAGRNMLVKILKGSRDKKVMEHHLDQCPAYGYYQDLTLDEISKRVDWMVEHDYIRIEYSGRLPMIVFSEKGWAIEEETYAEEIYQKFCQDLESGERGMLSQIKAVNREVVIDVLEKIRAGRNAEFLPMLEEWKESEVRKVREMISSVQRSLESPMSMPEIVYGQAGERDTKEVLSLIIKTVCRTYPQYYPEAVVDFFYMFHNKRRIQNDIREGNVRVLRCDGHLIGTGSLEGNHITRVYVLPRFQGKGYGTRIMDELEQEIRKGYDRAVLDSSLPAYSLYEKRGYRTVRHEKLRLPDDTLLEYEVMEKQLRTE